MEAWPEAEEGGRVAPKRGRLSGSLPHSWEWNELSPTEATYEGTKRLAGGQIERTIKKAVKLSPRKKRRSRLAIECAKLDAEFEKSLAEEGMSLEPGAWPEH